jgi:hypothetical protein
VTEFKSIPIAVLLLLAIGVLPVGCRQVDRFNDPYVSIDTGTALDILYSRNNQTTPLHVTAVSHLSAWASRSTCPRRCLDADRGGGLRLGPRCG